jgi:hypothetical protein
MSDDEVKVGNVGKTKKPVPSKTDKTDKATTAETVAPTTEGSSNGIAELNAKMDKLLELTQAIDWKMWVYLKANNYID